MIGTVNEADLLIYFIQYDRWSELGPGKNKFVAIFIANISRLNI